MAQRKEEQKRGEIMPGKKRNVKNGIRLALLILSCAALVFGICMLISLFLEYRKGEDFYNAAAERYVSEETEEGIENVPPGGTKDAEEDDQKTEGEGEESSPALSVDFTGLLAENDDIVGWLYQPGTVINYPVLQGVTNDDYLHASYDGSYLYAGSILLTCQNAADFSDDVSVLHGHNMRNLSMFGTLRYYFENTSEYLAAHPCFYLSMPDGRTRELEIFALVDTTASSPLYDTSLSGFESLKEYTDYALKSSVINTDITPDETDKVVLLSTCKYAIGDARYIVVCRAK